MTAKSTDLTNAQSIAPSTDAIAQLIANYFAAIRALDDSEYLNALTEDVVNHDPVGVKTTQGKSAMAESFTAMKGLFAQLEIYETFVAIAPNGEVAVKWSATGHTHGGKTTKFEGIDLFVIDATPKIQEIRAYWEPQTMLAQIKS
ncbi:MAG: nuclear transport factor 2 family protein [Oscillatoriales cyanobacterium SM2_2_1]|nr:nuclear transport factor 2 family protein [Oscillatoriales cyanobacterium SM2_2_1]